MNKEFLNFSVGPVLMEDEILEMGSEQIPYFRTQEFSDIMIDGIICHGAAIALKVNGLNIDKTTIQNVTIKNSSFVAEKDVEVNNAENVIFENVVINAKKWQ